MLIIQGAWFDVYKTYAMNSMLYHLPLLKCICIPIIIAQLIIEVIQNNKKYVETIENFQTKILINIP